MANLQAAANAAGHSDWGNGGPDNAGVYTVLVALDIVFFPFSQTPFLFPFSPLQTLPSSSIRTVLVTTTRVLMANSSLVQPLRLDRISKWMVQMRLIDSLRLVCLEFDRSW